MLRAIARCRTAALGGHLDRCAACGHRAISFNSCRNRHCPKCLTHARDQWLAERQRELLPVGYAHVVFTRPHALAGLALQNKQAVYDLLFQASAATLLEVARTPKHLGAALGFLSVFHTWGQTLLHHPHVHCVVPAGGLSPDGRRWVQAHPSFFLPVKVLSRVFRGKVVAGLLEAFRAGTLTLPKDLQRLTDESAFRTWLRTLYRHDWIVYAKPPFGGPSHSSKGGTHTSPVRAWALREGVDRCTRTRTRVARSPSAPAPSRFNTHSGAPCPPQTPAASFKRLYRE